MCTSVCKFSKAHGIPGSCLRVCSVRCTSPHFMWLQCDPIIRVHVPLRFWQQPNAPPGCKDDDSAPILTARMKRWTTASAVSLFENVKASECIEKNANESRIVTCNKAVLQCAIRHHPHHLGTFVVTSRQPILGEPS